MAFASTSCNKFLDKDPLGQIAQDEFFNSETNANAAVGTTTRAPHANQFQDRAATSGSMADADAAKYAGLQPSEAKWCCGPGRRY